MKTPVADAAHPGRDGEAIARALRASEARLRSVINSAPLVLWALDREGTFTFSEGRGLDLLGLRPGEVVGRSIFEVYAEVPQVIEESRRALAGEELMSVVEVAGSTFEVRYSPLRDEGGAPDGAIGVAVDVTERQRAEEELRRSEERTREILEAAHEAFIAMDTDGRILAWNLEAERTFGWPREEAIGQPLSELIIPPRYREAHHRGIEHFLATGEGPVLSQRIELVGQHRQGHEIPIELTISAIRQGESYLFTAFLHDISERKRAEASLQRRVEQTTRFQAALLELAKADDSDLDSNLSCILRVCADAVEVERVSAWFFSEDGSELRCRLLYTRADGRYQSGMSLRADEMPDYFRALRERRIVAAHAALEDLATHEFADAYLRPLGITSMLDVPIWRRGQMVGVVCHEHVGPQREWTLEEQDFAASIADMVSLAVASSERARAERAARENEARKAAVVESALDCIVTMDHTGRIVEFNPEAERVFGFSAEEVIGKQMARLLIPEQLREAHGKGVKRYLATGETHYIGNRIETTALRADGSEFPIELTVTHFVSEGEPLFTGFMRDITQRKEAEAALRASEQRAQAMAARMRAVAAAAAGVLGAESLDALQEVLREACRQVIQFDAFTFALYDPEAHTLSLLPGYDAGVYVPARTISAARVPMERVLRERRSLLTLRAEDPQTAGSITMGTGQRSESIIRTPILSGSRVLGALSVQSYTPDLYTPEDVEVLEAIASLAANALENIRLQAERQAADEALRRSHEQLEHRVAERTAELREKTSELEAIFQALPDLYFRLDADRKFLDFRAGQSANLFTAPEQFLGRRMQEVLPPEVAQPLEEGVREVERTGELVSVEYCLPVEAGEREFEARLLPFLEGQIISVVRDITDRKEAERALQRSEEHFRRITENSSDVASILDARGIGVYHSPSVERVLGYPVEEILGTSAFDRIHPDDHQKCRDGLGAMFRNPGQDYTVEFRYLNGQKGWRVLEVIGRTLLPDSAAEGVIINARDVTERKEAEEALRRSEERFRALIENGSDLITVIEPDGIVRYQSPSVQRVLGYDPAELVGHDARDFAHPDDVGRMTEIMEAALREPGTALAVEFRFRHQDGSWRIFEGIGKTVLADSAAEGLVINSRDITERKQAEAALRESSERFRTVVENASDIISILSPEGLVRYQSPASERLLGYSEEELLGRSVFEFVHPEDLPATAAAFQAVVQTGAIRRAEFRFRHQDGSWRVMEGMGVALRGEEGTHSVIVQTRDMTERKQAEAALQQAMQEAEEANRAKSEFLSRMSHELRTPMNSILGFAQLLERKPLAPKDRTAVEHILKAGRHLLNLINEVLDIARIEANRQQFSIEPVPLDAVVEEALSLIRPLAAERGSRIEECSTFPELYVRADRQRLTQVLLNLLSNAVKYNRPGGSLCVRWELAETEEDGEVRLRVGVQDTGPGIAPEKQAQLFVPFERLGAEQSGVEGTGLGLALSQRLVEAMGGSLSVESVVGEGSTFWLEFPQELSPLERLTRDGGAGAAAPEGEGDTRAATLLYIEDNLANLTLIESILDSRPQITLVPALQGQIGLELAYQHRPDLILLDLHLPDMRGDEVLERLRGDPRTRAIPVVIISADAMPGRIERLKLQGVHTYLTKPLDVDRFLEIVDGVLGERGE